MQLPACRQRLPSDEKCGLLQWRADPTGILYEGSSGIWQTVWLEGVPSSYISALQILPDLDSNTVTVTVTATGSNEFQQPAQAEPYYIVASLIDGNTSTTISSAAGLTGNPVQIPIGNAQLWTPDQPVLHALDIQLVNASLEEPPPVPPPGTPAEDLASPLALDAVESYTGLRKYSACQDSQGILVFCLNDEPRFIYGAPPACWTLCGGQGKNIGLHDLE